jgi:Amt family ammonium transporter
MGRDMVQTSAASGELAGASIFERAGNGASRGKSTALAELLKAMRAQREQGDFSTPVDADPETEVGQIAAEYNRVLERVKSEMRAREDAVAAALSAHEKFRSIFENSVEGIFQTTLDGRYLSVNPALARIYGYDSPETLIAGLRNISRQLYVDPDRRRQFRQALESHETVLNFESRVYRADGSIIWISENARVVRDARGTPQYYEGTVVDISERREQEAMLQAAHEKAEQANRAKSAFLANMSHEIRTPMTAILGYADLLLEQELAPPCVEMIGIIKRNGDHLLEIINSILDLSKIEAGRLALETLPCDPCAMVAELASFMRVRAASKRLELEVEFRGAVPRQITTDPTRLRQILINLIGNAIKFTDRGHVRVTMSLVNQNAASCALQFEILDTGIGITAAELARVFEPFTQADVSTTRLFGGTGLGLSICRRLADILGGTLTATSTPGQGSRFVLTIPTGSLAGVPLLAPVAEAVATVDPPSTNSPRSPDPAVLSGRRILLAEDGPDNQFLISHFLRRAGADVTVVENGQLAVDVVLQSESDGNAFDVVLMDVQMPVLDGHSATRQLRRRGFSRPIVAVTAHAMNDDRETSLAAGCDEFVTKPVTYRSLVAAVWRVLADLGGTPTPPATAGAPL